MKTVTLEQTYRVGRKLGVNFNVVSVETLRYGINVELEHGRQHARTNVTNSSITKSAMIALAHLSEHLKYYEKLAIMEHKLEVKSRGRPKVSVFL